MEAVDSEFRRNLQSDVRRLFQLTKATSSPAHPFSKFSTGNLQTLSRTAVGSGKPHEAVRAFYERHYLAHQMHLCVFGRESLDELEDAVAKCFAELRTEAPPPAEDDDRLPPVLPPGLQPSITPFSNEQLGGLLRTKWVKLEDTLPPHHTSMLPPPFMRRCILWWPATLGSSTTTPLFISQMGGLSS